MFRWTPYPLIRIAVFFCGGILFAIYNPLTWDLTNAAVTCFAGLVLLLTFYLLRKKIAVARYLFWLGSLLIISISGFLLVKVRTESSLENHILHLHDSIQAYEAVIIDPFEEKKNSFKTTVAVSKVKTSGGWTEATGKVNFYISKTGFSHDLIWGDHIIVKGSPLETSPPSNPYEFNYKRFLTFRNVFHQHYVRQGDWAKTGEFDPGFLRYSAAARKYFTEVIQKYVQGKQEQAVSLALVIGVTDGIDNELVSAYSASGAMHVLAVSGLHVGIIYGILLFLLKPIQKDKRGKWMVAIISLVLLWSYAFITGLSPSVLRAVMMFSFMAVARPLNRRTNIFNTLAGSAFILLLIDPYLIMSVGFQLSYLAVIGIIWIQRPLYQLWEAPNRLMDWVWKISCVSIAAQATTFSLGLLYFHQFPTYFLFSNLIVIPISTAILILGIVLNAVSFSNPLAAVVGWLLEKFSWLLNWSVFTVEGLPHSIISNIYIDVFQSWLILGILGSLIFLFQFRKMRWLYVSLILALAFSWAGWVHHNNRMNSSQAIVYSVNGSTAFEIIEHGQSFFIADSALYHDQERTRFHINGNRLYNLVNKVEGKVMKHEVGLSSMITCKDRSFLFVNRPIHDLAGSIKPDFVIVGKNGMWSVPMMMEIFPDAFFILDGTCSRYWAGRIKSSVEKQGSIYSVTEQGAFVLDL